MLDDLTPDQRTKVAQGWAWQVGQAAIWTNLLQAHKVRVHVDTGRERRLVVTADGERHMALVRDLAPDLNDPVTTDGLLRTARAMWRDESLHVVPHDTNVNDGKGGTMPARWWAVARVEESQPWMRSTSKEILVACENGTLRRYLAAPTEQAALLAAILAAPEAA